MLCVWSHSECRSFHLHSARSTKTVGGLFVPVSMKPQNVPGNKRQCPVGVPCLSDRKPNTGGHSSFSSVYQILSGGKTRVSMSQHVVLVYGVPFYINYIASHYHCIFECGAYQIFTFKFPESQDDIWWHFWPFTEENRKCGLEGSVTGERRQQSELLSQTQSCTGIFGQRNKGHHSRQKRRKTFSLSWATF